jgi:hypothetical protein
LFLLQNGRVFQVIDPASGDRNRHGSQGDTSGTDWQALFLIEKSFFTFTAVGSRKKRRS